jgi:hypothetical protein
MMADVERLNHASRVPIEIVDPRDVDARYCLRSYVEELGHRFDTGFDRARSISAKRSLRESWVRRGRALQ